MKVYLLKSVTGIGIAGQIVKVKDGYAQNFLVPRKLAVVLTEKNEQFYAAKVQKVHVDKEAVKSKMGILAEHIKNVRVSLKKKVHDDGKLYGAVSADDVVTLLATKEVNITKKQVVFTKSIKSIGEHRVAVKLSSKLQPQFTLKVVAE